MSIHFSRWLSSLFAAMILILGGTGCSLRTKGLPLDYEIAVVQPELAFFENALKAGSIQVDPISNGSGPRHLSFTPAPAFLSKLWPKERALDMSDRPGYVALFGHGKKWELLGLYEANALLRRPLADLGPRNFDDVKKVLDLKMEVMALIGTEQIFNSDQQELLADLVKYLEANGTDFTPEDLRCLRCEADPKKDGLYCGLNTDLGKIWIQARLHRKGQDAWLDVQHGGAYAGIEYAHEVKRWKVIPGKR